MARFFVKRLGGLLLTLWLVITLVFGMLRAAPGGPFDSERVVPREVTQALNAKYALDAPLVEQYQRRPTIDVATFEYMLADVELAVAQRGVEVTVDGFLLEQIAALMMAALRRLLTAAAPADLLARTCENILRLIGLTPVQARREVARVAEHPLLDPDSSVSIVAGEGDTLWKAHSNKT